MVRFCEKFSWKTSFDAAPRWWYPRVLEIQVNLWTWQIDETPLVRSAKFSDRNPGSRKKNYSKNTSKAYTFQSEKKTFFIVFPDKNIWEQNFRSNVRISLSSHSNFQSKGRHRQLRLGLNFLRHKSEIQDTRWRYRSSGQTQWV